MTTTDVTLADVLAKIKSDLAWRGPTDRPLGNIVLSRAYAEALHDKVIAIIKERDALVYEKDQAAKAACLHPMRSGAVGMNADGSGFSEWSCPTCRDGGRHEWPASKFPVVVAMTRDALVCEKEHS